MNDRGHAFSQDWVSPPGDTILDLMTERDWNQAELSRRLGYSTKHLNQLVKGKVSLTEDAALRLERVLGSTANFWFIREAKYREHLSRLQAQLRYLDWVSWLDELPLADLKKAHVIPDERITKAAKPALVEQLLRFFCIASPDEWQSHYGDMQTSFRQTRKTNSNVGAIASWLRLGEIEAAKLETPKYNKIRFKKALKRIRALTVLTPEKFYPSLRDLCGQAGVKLVLAPTIPKAHVNGVARWLNGHSPLVQLSLYGKTNDTFWFTFFHEAAHILLHADNKTDIFLDDASHSITGSTQEDEANQWTRDILIPPSCQLELKSLRSSDAIRAFAEKLNIHSGIVVGRLQSDVLSGSGLQLNCLKDRFELL